MDQENSVRIIIFMWDVHCILHALVVQSYKQPRTIARRCVDRTSKRDGTYKGPNANRDSLRFEHMDVVNVETLAVHRLTHY